MKLRIGLIGSSGKMGQRIVDCSLKDPDISLLWQLGSNSSRDALPEVDVIIDFSSTSSLQDNLLLAEQTQTPIVIGTTGFQQKQQELLEKTALKVPVFWSPNFSLGMAILVRAIESLAPFLQKKFKPEITEIHHIHKKDKPSGSALALAQAVQTSYPDSPEIHSVRLGEAIGEHSVVFLAENEKLTFHHESFSRDAFALGALEAAKFLVNKQPRLYRMEDLL